MASAACCADTGAALGTNVNFEKYLSSTTRVYPSPILAAVMRRAYDGEPRAGVAARFLLRSFMQG